MPLFNLEKNLEFLFMTPVTVSFVTVVKQQVFISLQSQKGYWEQRERILLLLLFGSKYFVTNPKYYSLLNFSRKTFSVATSSEAPP